MNIYFDSLIRIDKRVIEIEKSIIFEYYKLKFSQVKLLNYSKNPKSESFQINIVEIRSFPQKNIKIKIFRQTISIAKLAFQKLIDIDLYFDLEEIGNVFEVRLIADDHSTVGTISVEVDKYIKDLFIDNEANFLWNKHIVYVSYRCRKITAVKDLFETLVIKHSRNLDVLKRQSDELRKMRSDLWNLFPRTNKVGVDERIQISSSNSKNEGTVHDKEESHIAIDLIIDPKSKTIIHQLKSWSPFVDALFIVNIFMFLSSYIINMVRNSYLSASISTVYIYWWYLKDDFQIMIHPFAIVLVYILAFFFDFIWVFFISNSFTNVGYHFGADRSETVAFYTVVITYTLMIFEFLAIIISSILGVKGMLVDNIIDINNSISIVYEDEDHD